MTDVPIYDPKVYTDDEKRQFNEKYELIVENAKLTKQSKTKAWRRVAPEIKQIRKLVLEIPPNYKDYLNHISIQGTYYYQYKNNMDMFVFDWDDNLENKFKVCLVDEIKQIYKDNIKHYNDHFNRKQYYPLPSHDIPDVLHNALNVDESQSLQDQANEFLNKYDKLVTQYIQSSSIKFEELKTKYQTHVSTIESQIDKLDKQYAQELARINNVYSCHCKSLSNLERDNNEKITLHKNDIMQTYEKMKAEIENKIEQLNADNAKIIRDKELEHNKYIAELEEKHHADLAELKEKHRMDCINYTKNILNTLGPIEFDELAKDPKYAYGFNMLVSNMNTIYNCIRNSAPQIREILAAAKGWKIKGMFGLNHKQIVALNSIDNKMKQLEIMASNMFNRQIHNAIRNDEFQYAASAAAAASSINDDTISIMSMPPNYSLSTPVNAPVMPSAPAYSESCETKKESDA